MDTFEERRADLVVRSYLSALERRDPGARAHGEHVAAIATAIAAVMGFTDCALRQVRRAGLLHDIGKLAIRDALIRKPGTLTDAEYAEVQEHSIFGGIWLMGVPELQAIIPGVLHHHERWDGTGYPLGLAGRAIPLIARILAVADVYDALRADRVYRPGLPTHQAIAIVVEGAGTRFDPAIVEVFVRAVTSVDPYSVACATSSGKVAAGADDAAFNLPGR